MGYYSSVFSNLCALFMYLIWRFGFANCGGLLRYLNLGDYQ